MSAGDTARDPRGVALKLYIWDFFSHSPEATHQFTWLFGDRGIPASFRSMDGFGSHTFQWVNAKGERCWVKFHLKTDQGIKCLTTEEAKRIGGHDPAFLHQDLYDAIARRRALRPRRCRLRAPAGGGDRRATSRRGALRHGLQTRQAGTPPSRPPRRRYGVIVAVLM